MENKKMIATILHHESNIDEYLEYIKLLDEKYPDSKRLEELEEIMGIKGISTVEEAWDKLRPLLCQRRALDAKAKKADRKADLYIKQPDGRF